MSKTTNFLLGYRNPDSGIEEKVAAELKSTKNIIPDLDESSPAAIIDATLIVLIAESKAD